MATTPTSSTGSGERRYPELPPRNWTPEQAEAWLQRLREHQDAIIARRGRAFSREELDDLLEAVREGRD